MRGRHPCVHGLGAFKDSDRDCKMRHPDDHAGTGARGSHDRHQSRAIGWATRQQPFAAILLLDPFERFVFVLSILEGMPGDECANLLGCSGRDVMLARVLALQSSMGAQA